MIESYKRKSADFEDNRRMLFDYSEMSEEQLPCVARHVIDSINDSKVSGANQVSIEHLETCVEIGLKQGMAKQDQLDKAVEALEEITNIVQEHGEAVTIWDVVSIAQEALSEMGGDCDE